MYNPLGWGLVVINVLLSQRGAVEVLRDDGEGHGDAVLGVLHPHGKQVLLGVGVAVTPLLVNGCEPVVGGGGG